MWRRSAVLTIAVAALLSASASFAEEPSPPAADQGNAAPAQAQAAKPSAQLLSAAELDFPQAEDGASGVRFIGKCVESSHKGAVWVDF